MVCVTTRGGDYSPGSPFHAHDFQEPYLRAIFSFIGIEEIEFVNAQPMDITPEPREKAIADAVQRAEELAVWASEISQDGPVEPSPAELKPRPLQPERDRRRITHTRIARIARVITTSPLSVI